MVSYSNFFDFIKILKYKPQFEWFIIGKTTIVLLDLQKNKKLVDYLLLNLIDQVYLIDDFNELYELDIDYFEDLIFVCGNI